MNYHDSQLCKNECNDWDLYFSHLKIHFRGFEIHLHLKDYRNHEGVNSHMASVQVYLVAYSLSPVRTRTLSSPLHKSLYKHFSLYEFVEPVLKTICVMNS